jgi:hypothetical protein
MPLPGPEMAIKTKESGWATLRAVRANRLAARDFGEAELFQLYLKDNFSDCVQFH